MAMIFTIDLIEGNSHIGVPVFSSSAKKENKNWMVFSQPKRPKNQNDDEDEELVGAAGGASTVSKDFNRGDKVSENKWCLKRWMRAVLSVFMDFGVKKVSIAANFAKN